MAKTETLTKLVVDCSTGETTEVALTAEELAQRDLDIAAAAERQAAEQARAAAKTSAQAKLAALGLTAEEISALG